MKKLQNRYKRSFFRDAVQEGQVIETWTETVWSWRRAWEFFRTKQIRTEIFIVIDKIVVVDGVPRVYLIFKRWQNV